MSRKILITFVFFFCASASLHALITIEEYVKDVEENNSDVKATNLSIEASKRKILELDMVYSPLLSADVSYMDDKSGAEFGSTLIANEMKATQFNIGTSKKFITGSTLTLGYSNSKADFNLLSPLQFGSLTLTNFSGYELRPFFKIEQSLLRDFFSGITQSGIKKVKSSVRAGQYMQYLKKQQTLLQARYTYWTLSLAREILAFRKISLNRTEKLFKWNEKKVSLDLAENVDLLQSQAAYKLRELNLQQAVEDEIKACRDFNEFLGKQCEEVTEDIEPISRKISYYQNISDLNKKGERADVLSARSMYDSAKFAEKETYYRALPEINFSGMYSLHGLDIDYENAWKQVANSEKPTYSLGLNFIVPLDFWTLSKVKKGYALDFNSAKESLKNTEISAANDWEQLSLTWKNVKSRLALAKEIRDIQENRVKEEQVRLERGKTTTFQLLTAENDLDDATINLYRLVFEELTIAAQSELYNTQPFKD